MGKFPPIEPVPPLRSAGAALLSGLILAGCAHLGDRQVLGLEHHTVRMPLTVDRDGVAHLAAHPPLVGTLDLGPILDSEGIRAAPGAYDNLQLLIHFGRFYVTGDGFRAVWVISPHPGSATGEYRPIPVVPEGSSPPLREVRLSRYGSAENTCVRVDRAGGEAVFINAENRIDTTCQ